MKLRYIVTAAALVSLVACNDDEVFEKEQYKNVFGFVSESDNTNTKVVSLHKEESVGYMSLSMGGSNPIKRDVTVNIVEDESLIDAYNSANFGCVIFLFYIKPQRRAGYRLIMRCLCGKSVARKCACAIRRSGNDAILSILYANVSKKFQLLRHVGLFPFDLAPEIANLAVLLVRDAQHAGVPRRRHRFAYPFDMYRHILLGCAMSYINRVLHHGKTVFLQRLAKQSRMTSLGLCIGRQVEEYE